MKRILMLLIWLLATCTVNNASAGLYGKCITGYNFNDAQAETFSLYPINSDCYTQCDAGCKSIFSALNSEGVESNQDVINRCKSYCQSSTIFSSYYRSADGDLIGPAAGFPSPSSCYADQVWNRVYKARTTFKPGGSFVINASDNPSVMGNKIYGCGYDTVKIQSIFKDDRTVNWPVISPWPLTTSNSASSVTNDSVQTIWTDSKQHYCLNSATNYPLSSITKSKLLTGLDYATINRNLLPSQPLPYSDSPTSAACTPSSSVSCSILPDYRTSSDMLSWYRDVAGPCAFSARVDQVSTGLYVQDGDELSISWSGNFSTVASNVVPNQNCMVSDVAQVAGLTIDQAIMCARNAAINSQYKITTDAISTAFKPSAVACQKWASLQSRMEAYFGSNAIIFNGESARVDPIFTKGTDVALTSSGSIATTDVSSSYNMNNYACAVEPSALGSDQISVYGLVGSVKDDPNPTLNSPYSGSLSCSDYWSGGSCPDRSVNCSSCIYINGSNSLGSSSVIGNMAYSTYTYQGVLGGVPLSSSGLAIATPTPISPTRSLMKVAMAYAGGGDEVGGIDVSITWGGCPMTPESTNRSNTPTAMEYVISACSLDPTQMYDKWGYDLTSASWTSYSWTALPVGTTINVTSSNCTSSTCCVYFRVKDPYITQSYSAGVGLSSSVPSGATYSPLWGSTNVGLKNLYANAGNRYGSYALSLSIPKTTFTLPKASTTGLMQGVVSYVNKTIIGTSPNYNNGVLKSFYTNVISGYGYQSFVRALLAMYMAFLGLGFIMGTVKIDLRELVGRLVKVGFVITMLSTTSWTMFSTYVLPGIVNGAADLSSSFVLNVAGVSGMSSNFPATASNVPLATAMASDPSIIIALMVDQPLQYMWGTSVLWTKVQALVFSAWWGWAFALILVVSMIVYSIGLLKIVMIYCLSLLGVAVLVFIAPLVIPMILFKFTEHIFETWWKLLLSYAMQPIMLFAGVSILNFLTLAVFYASLSYTVCPYCLLTVPFFGLDYCLIYVYTILDSLHAPGSLNGFVPTALVTSSSLFLLLAYAMYEMPSIFTSMASKLITGSVAAVGNVGAASDGAFNKVGMASAGDIAGTVIKAVDKANSAYEGAKTVGRAAARFTGALGAGGGGGAPDAGGGGGAPDAGGGGGALGAGGGGGAPGAGGGGDAPGASSSLSTPANTPNPVEAAKAESKEVMPKSLADSGGPKKASVAPKLSTISEDSTASSMDSIAEGDESEED